jgi:hypothetical protein
MGVWIECVGELGSSAKDRVSDVNQALFGSEKGRATGSALLLEKNVALLVMVR